MKSFKTAAFIVFCTLFLKQAPAQALTVVSDIDDTAKISDVLDLGDAAYRELKIRQFTGMSEAYRGVVAQTKATFIYLSGGPNILRFIDDHFLSKYTYPAGDLILKQSSENGLDIGAYKIAHLQQIMAASTDDFIFIGDDTQKDFSSYATIAAQFPGRVKQIYIHSIRGQPLSADAVAAHEVPYLSAFDLAMHLYNDETLGIDGLKNVALAIQNQDADDSEQVIADFQACPKDYTPVTGNDPTANSIATLVTPRILNICANRRQN